MTYPSVLVMEKEPKQDYFLKVFVRYADQIFKFVSYNEYSINKLNLLGGYHG